jgi:hypothetical protein
VSATEEHIPQSREQSTENREHILPLAGTQKPLLSPTKPFSYLDSALE